MKKKTCSVRIDERLIPIIEEMATKYDKPKQEIYELFFSKEVVKSVIRKLEKEKKEHDLTDIFSERSKN